MSRAGQFALLLAAGLALAAGTSRAGTELAPDETALRYFASQGQRARVDAEIRRMKLVHPGWQPPVDLWTARPGGPEEAPLWRLFAADRLDDLDGAIEARRRAEPGWRPSPDLAAKIARKRLRLSVMAAAAAGRWQAVAEAAADASPGPDDLELAWTVAEARARSGQPAAAAAAYRAILVADLPPEPRKATLLKSMAVLPMASVEALASAAAMAGLDLAPLRNDLARGRIAAILRGEKGVVPPDADLPGIEDEATASGDAASLSLVAWYALHRQRPGDAVAWFRKAMAAGGDAMVAHGLARALLALGRREEAAATALAWSDRNANNAILVVDLAAEDVSAARGGGADPAVLQRLATATLGTASGEGAQALGWYAYAACDAAGALPWFERAVAWHPREGSVLGLALTLQRLGHRRDALDLANRYDGLFPRLVALASARAGGGSDPCARTAGRPAAAPLAAVPVLAGRADGPLFARGEFPRPVAAENPLRAAAGAGGTVARVGIGPAAALPARRVVGAAAMPYEPDGPRLAPAWNGDDRSPAVSALQAPAAAGTLAARTTAAPPASQARATALPAEGRFGPAARRPAAAGS